MNEPRQTKTEARRKRFGTALRALIDAHPDVTQATIGARLGYASSTVGQWVNGQAVPEPDVVFELEDMFGLPANTLSRHLNYGRLDDSAVAAVDDILAAVDAEVGLPQWAKNLMKKAYEEGISSLGGGRRRV